MVLVLLLAQGQLLWLAQPLLWGLALASQVQLCLKLSSASCWPWVPSCHRHHHHRHQ